MEEGKIFSFPHTFEMQERKKTEIKKNLWIVVFQAKVLFLAEEGNYFDAKGISSEKLNNELDQELHVAIDEYINDSNGSFEINIREKFKERLVPRLKQAFQRNIASGEGMSEKVDEFVEKFMIKFNESFDFIEEIINQQKNDGAQKTNVFPLKNNE